MATIPHSAKPKDKNNARLIIRTEDGRVLTHEVFDRFLNEMYGHLRSTENPRLLVILTSAYFELFTNTLIDHHCRNKKRIGDDSRTYSWSVKKVILAELGVISEDHHKVLDWFRGLRNRAAHRDQFEITQKDIDKWPIKETSGPFGMITLTIRNRLEFRSVCMELISFWIGSDQQLLSLVLTAPEEVPRRK